MPVFFESNQDHVGRKFTETMKLQRTSNTLTEAVISCNPMESFDFIFRQPLLGLVFDSLQLFPISLVMIDNVQSGHQGYLLGDQVTKVDQVGSVRWVA